MSSQQANSSGSNSPTNILGSPFTVISSSLKSPASPSLGFESISSSQVRRPCVEIVLHELFWILVCPLSLFLLSSFSWIYRSTWKGRHECFTVAAICFQVSSSSPASGMHSISSSEDIKPPFGLRPVPAHSPGLMMSQKRMCVICGDRSSGEWRHLYFLHILPS